MWHRLNLNKGGVDFVASLIVLDSKGHWCHFWNKDWLNKHKVHIDLVEKSIKLTTSDRNELEYITEPIVTTKGATNRVKLNQLDASQGPEVLVVNEFFDVLPKELSVMPPDRDIEFVIE
jgi:hypothetical protein